MEKNKMIGPIEALKKSWEIVKNSKLYIFKLLLVAFLVMIPSIILGGYIEGSYPTSNGNTGYGSYNIERTTPLAPVWLTGSYSIVNLVSQCLVTSFITLGLLNLYNSQKPKAKEVLRNSFKVLPGFIAVYILMSLIIMAGFLLLIIPGIIFIAMYYLSTYIYLDKKTGVIESLKESKKLTSGYKWKLLIRVWWSSTVSVFIFILPILILGAVFMILSSSPLELLKITPPLVMVLLGIFLTIYCLVGWFVVASINLMLPIIYYKDLERIKQGDMQTPSASQPPVAEQIEVAPDPTPLQNEATL